MSTDDPPKPSLTDQLAADAAGAATTKAAEALAKGAVAAVGKAADSALDVVERMLFGKVGGADDALKHEANPDPIARFRQEMGGTPEAGQAVAPAPKPTRAEAKEAAMNEARKQLEALKKARDAKQTEASSEPVERKRTL